MNRCGRVSLAPWLLAVALAPATVTAQPLTLHQAITQALAANPSLTGQRHQTDALALERNMARGRQLPSVEMQAGYTHYSDPMLVWPLHQIGSFPPLDQDVASAGLYLTLPLYAGGRLVAGEALAEQQYRAALHQYTASAQELAFNVVAAYAKSLQLHHLVAALTQRVKRLEAEAADVAQRLALGRAAPLEKMRIETQLAQARYERVQVQQGERNALALLAALLGSETPPELLEIETFPDATGALTLEAALAQARRQHPDLQRAESELAAAGHKLDIARGERLPSVNLLGNARRLEGVDSAGQDEWQLGVQLTWPLYDGNVRESRTSQVALQQQAAQAQRQAVADRLGVEVQEAWGGISTGKAQLATAQRAQQEADEALRIETLRYRSGAGTVTELLAAEAAQWAAQASLSQAHYDLTFNQARLLKVLGRLTPDGMTHIE